MTSVPVTIQERIPMPVNVAARPAGPAGGMNVGDVIRILKQRIFLIMFLWIFMTASAAGISFYLAAKHPLFTARSAVYVESPTPKNPLQLTERTVQVELMDRFVADQAVLLKDDKVLDGALQAAPVLETTWYRAQPDKDELLIELKDDLFVRQISNTNYLAVSFATRDREDAPVIVNEVIRKYLAEVQAASQAQYSNELADYNTEETRLVNALEDVRAKKRQFLSEEMGTAGATEGLNVVGETWRALAAEVTRLEAEKLQNQAAYENLVGVDPSQIAISPQMTLMIEQDTQVAGLKNQELALNQEIATALQRLGQNHRAVQDLKAQLLVVDETLQKIMAQKEKEIREYQVNVAHTSFLNAMQAELQLRERMLEAEAMQRDLDQALTVYRQLEEDQLLLEHQLTQIREHINLLEMIIKDRGMVRVRQIGQAQLPKLRSFPDHLLNIPAGSILGLLLGIGLAFLLEFIDTSVKTSQDIVRHVHIPLLGTVPDLDDEELAIEQMELAAHTAPHSMIAEAFRTIRANLQLSAPAEKQKTVLITSARPEEGKTSIAMNLAISIGQSGRRVLLLDTNFRRPILHQMFPNAPREGLSNLLIGQGRIEDLTAPSDLPNIDVMTSGPIPPNPTELLAGQYLKDILNQLGQNYDQIIIDGPPVLLVTDVLVMASNVDGMILVCRAKTSSRGAIMRAREQLERVNAHVFGAVLNAARVSRGGYFREQIRTYYDYQPEEALAPTTIAPSLPGEQGDGLDIQDDRNNEPR